MHKMIIFSGLFVVALGVTACGEAEPDLICGGLSSALPTPEEAVSGLASWSEAGVSESEPGSWNGGTNGDITFGTITLIIAKDENGNNIDDLVSGGTFPICIPLGERSEQSGNATDTGAFVTDANNGGHVVILGQEANDLIGRFDFTMGNASGQVRELTNGVFRIPPR